MKFTKELAIGLILLVILCVVLLYLMNITPCCADGYQNANNAISVEIKANYEKPGIPLFSRHIVFAPKSALNSKEVAHRVGFISDDDLCVLLSGKIENKLFKTIPGEIVQYLGDSPTTTNSLFLCDSASKIENTFSSYSYGEKYALNIRECGFDKNAAKMVCVAAIIQGS